MLDHRMVFWNQPVHPQIYAETTREVDRLWEAGCLREVLDLLESTWPGLPDTRLHTSWIDPLILKAYFQAQTGRPSESLATLEAMSRCDVSSHLSSPAYDTLRDLPGYAELAQKNEALLTRERSEARVETDVRVPTDLRHGQPDPLMLVLHGDPGNLTTIRDAWSADSIVARGVIVAYLQSSQLRSTSRYLWTTDPTVARSDLRAAYDEIRARYPIDTSRVILGGFSAGATTALDALFAETVPAAGFVCLCAGDRPEHLTRENVEAAKKRGVRGVFFEGEENWPDEEEQEMLRTMKEVGLPVEFVLNEGMSHGAPPDFPEKLDRAVRFILEGSEE